MIIVQAPYPRFRIEHMKFNVSGRRYCNSEDVKFLKNVDPNIAIFKYMDGKELNPKPIPKIVKPKTIKPKIKKEAPDALKDTKHSDSKNLRD